MNKKHIIFYTIFSFFFSNILFAKENIPNPNSNDSNALRVVAAGCLPATAMTNLNVNNVTTLIMTGGDMWWDLNDGIYEIPTGSNKHSMFAGALWIGGLDDQDNLKVAAMTYRQDGNDFWPGPLNADNTSSEYGSVSASTCAEYDRHFKITRQEVEDYVSYLNCQTDPTCVTSIEYPDYNPPSIIADWPASRIDVDGTFDYLAPFVDVNNDGEYNEGDYPAYDLEGTADCKADDVLFGDQTLWWVFNDNGNIHTETGSESAIGLEIQAQAFGFSTNDEINDMTFYSYKIMNRSTESLNETYFGQWVDPDLGNYQDDYVGCDVSLGLGYCYNGDAEDDGASGYNYDSDDPPPAIGVDFFRGPLADPNDGLDNDGDGEIDEDGEQIIMSKFVYYNNDFSEHGNPEEAIHYYNYLKGIWKDGQNMTYGGTGWEAGNPLCNYMFPDDTDPNFTESWTEITAGNDPADRRFLQSAGPFSLEPGAVNYITIGVVWARASEGNNFASVEKMKLADRKAQTLFDICFEVIDGPSAPDMQVVELDEEIILNLTYTENSNNFGGSYIEQDPFISDVLSDQDGDGVFEALPIDRNYSFEGYQVFQLRDPQVSVTDLYDPNKAYMIYQSDIENYLVNDDESGQLVVSPDPSDDSQPIANLINYNLDESVGPGVFVPQNMTLGASNEGLVHSIQVLTDKFSTGTPELVNNKPYYFMVIAYAHNEYIKYKPDTPFDSSNPYAASSVGQKKPYLAGRKNIKVYTAIPHKTEPTGNLINSEYAMRPAIIGLAGSGNGGYNLDITLENRNQIAINNFVDTLFYLKDFGPIDISIIDPLSVPDADFIFEMKDVVYEDGILTDAHWELTKIQDGEVTTISSSNSMSDKVQQVIPEWGLGVTLKNVVNPTSDQAIDKGFLGLDATNLSIESSPIQLVQDFDGFPQFAPITAAFDWIRSGTNNYPDSDPVLGQYSIYSDYGMPSTPEDPNEVFEVLTGGVIAPYQLLSTDYKHEYEANDFTFRDTVGCGPAFKDFKSDCSLDSLNNVDIIFTSNKSLWTRVPIIEMAEEIIEENGSSTPNGLGGAEKWDLRTSESVDKNGNSDGTGTGWGWFPGYAIDVSKGIRLDMMISEDSSFPDQNGADMIFNPTDEVWVGQSLTNINLGNADFNTFSEVSANDICFGGKHWVFVLNTPYQGDDHLLNTNIDLFDNWQLASRKKKLLPKVTWVMPVMGTDTDINSNDWSDIEFKVRITEKYATRNFSENEGAPKYRFSTGDLFTIFDDPQTQKDGLEMLNVVPNPYNGVSSYETSQLDNRVKIINLPNTCTISIYTINGSLINQIKKDNDKPEIEWDLNNMYGIPISSGLYIIHVDAPGIGEKVIKWFGTMRPIDLNTF
ncbi:MAG: hypothetical protein CMP68_01130 [Flavobacteriales bacterium]|nr:hypothetical protein [Flavobacteriales bacterium]|tara:strand:- start:16933 stop:21045 length:4113 start_codon:yes stop_codon:yes gene_type:complete